MPSVPAITKPVDWLRQDVSNESFLTGIILTVVELHEEYPEYLWYPEVLAKVSHSGENLAYQLRDYIRKHDRSDSDLKSFVSSLIKNGLGISDASAEEVDSIVKNIKDPAKVVYNFNDMVSRRSQTGWSTHGHSGMSFSCFLTSAHIARRSTISSPRTKRSNTSFYASDISPSTTHTSLTLSS